MASGTATDLLSVTLSIRGIGLQYPKHIATIDDLKDLTYRHYPQPSLDIEKALARAGKSTGISRTVACPYNHPLLNGPRPPTIDEISQFFQLEGVNLAVEASREAIAEWKGDISQITHVVATTFTDTSNPGFDYYIAKDLGLHNSVERILLHGVACAGGMAAMRTAAGIAQGAALKREPARILVIACELFSPHTRAELDRLNESQGAVGLNRYGDCASAVVLSNGIGEDPHARPIYEYLGWVHRTLPTIEISTANVYAYGWRGKESTLSAILPPIPSLLDSVLSRVPKLVSNGAYPAPAKFDWVVPPNKGVLSGVQQLMGITEDHLRASYDVYMNHGNPSSPAPFGMLDRLRNDDMGPGREYVIGCAFGPGPCAEMCVLRRPTIGCKARI